MTYQIDFLPVGDASKGGDAICFRFWDDFTPQFVGVIDGGTKAAGEKLVEHIKTFYETETVDVVINTHPHADHTSGLMVVLEQLEVNLLMMHLPWEHSEDILHLFHDGRITSNSLGETIKKGLQQTHDLYVLSLEKKIPVAEPFVGADTGSPSFCIVGPTLNFYRGLIPQFTSTPQAASLSETLAGFVRKAVSWIKETWDEDELGDPSTGTNAENNSSVISMLVLDGKRILFTADAGVPALEGACDCLEYNQIPLADFAVVQIPHHGSKRNVGPTILNRLIGPIVGDAPKTFTAMASVPISGAPRHPSPRVMNAFNRRGATVSQTCGKTVCHGDWASRPGWSAVTPIPLYTEVEEDES